MKTDDVESQLNAIRAMLAKAEATNFPGEAETYTAKAMALMSKWGIEKALLEDAKPTTGIADRIFTLEAPFARDKVNLLFVVVSALGGRSVLIQWRQGKVAGQQRLHVFATETDLARIDMLFTSLLVQCSAAMNHAVSVSREAQYRPRKFKSDFLLGFSDTVGYRLRAAEREAAKAAEGMAAAQGTTIDLVLVGKKDRVDARVEDVYKDLVSTKHRNREVGGGYGHGADAGKRADIGGSKGAKQGALVG